MSNHKYQEQAREELGVSKLDSARGTILGIVFAVFVVVLYLGIDDFDQKAPGIKFGIWIFACGTIGYFSGNKIESEHFEKVRKRAEELESSNRL